MRIAQLTPTFSAFSGIDRVVYQLATEQKDKGDNVTIFTLEADMKPPEGVRLRIMAMPKNPTLQRIYRLFMPLDLYKAIKWVPELKDFDVIYSHYYPMNWLAYQAKKFYGVKYIFYDYGVAPPETFSNFIESTYMRIQLLFTNWTARQADSAISISQYLSRKLRERTSLISKVAYCLTDSSQFHEELDSSLIRDKYNLGNSLLLVYIGRISPHKGIHLLIEVFNIVKQQIPGVRLLIVGKHTFPDYSKKLRTMADDSVIFAGYVTDKELPYYYAACDVYVTATMWEGFNLPLVEAQACGKPVVAFNIGPHPEVVGLFVNQSGLLVLPGNINALANAVIRLLKNDKLRYEMGKNALKVVRDKFLF